MENWQFLIQKQGDRTWQSLEGPNLEILEGQYRVLARSNFPNVDVEVRVTHSSTHEVPPRRRVLKRLRRTSIEGIIAVIPYTYLQPGTWELQCSSDLMSEMLGKSWQCKVVLQVLATEANGLLIETTSENLDQPVSPVWFKGETIEQILHNLIDSALPNFEPLHLEAKITTLPPKLLKLSLNQYSYVARRGEPLTIKGYVEFPEIRSPEAPESFFNLQLRIELRSPLESKILTEVQQTLPDQVIPCKISALVEIPAECESKLILADINLEGRPTGVDEVQLLASQSFTITADVTQLLAITSAAKSRNPTTTAEFSQRLGLELFNLAKNPLKIPQPPPLSPSPPQPLPPQIYTPVLSNRWPQLPMLPINKNKATTTVSGEAPVNIATINFAQLVIKPRCIPKSNTSFPYLKRLGTLPDERENSQQVDLNSETTLLDESVISAELTAAENDLTTETTLENDYNPLLDEFVISAELMAAAIIRENDLTSETILEKDHSPLLNESVVSAEFTENVILDKESTADLNSSSLLRKWIEKQENSLLESLNQEASVSEEIEPPQLPLSPSPQRQSTWLTREIVIDDLDSELSAKPKQPSSNSLPLLDGVIESLPTPQMYVPEGELIAGKSVRIYLEIPKVAPQVAIKLWIEDYQTRYLLDGPHLLTNLLPNSLGRLEVMTQTNVPFGCLEIRLEAIALDLITQQESHKVTVVRRVIPPDLRSFPRLDI